MDDLLLLIRGLIKFALVLGIVVLVATAPSRCVAASYGLQSSLFAGAAGASAVYCNYDGETKNSLEGAANFVDRSALDQTSFLDMEPVDHEPDDWRYDSNHVSMTAFDFLENSTNIDGTPMCGSVDINGNAYGITEGPIESAWGGDMTSMFD